MKLTGGRCQCPSCGEYFNSVAAFDKHRTGKAERRCMDQQEMTHRGMAKNAAGWWITAVNPKWSVR